MAAQPPAGSQGSSQQQWWVIPEASSSNLSGTFVVVEGTEQAIRAKYGPVAQGPYATQADAQAAAGNEPGIPGNPGTAIKQGAGGLLSGLNPLSALFQSNIWLRVVEVIAGLILLGIGVNALFRSKPLQIVTSTAGLAAKAVP